MTPIEPVASRSGSYRSRSSSRDDRRPHVAVSADGLTQTFVATQRPRLHGRPRPRTTGRRRGSSAARRSASTTGRARRPRPCSTRRADAFQRCERGSGRIRTRTTRSSSRPAATGWSARASIWIPTGVGGVEPALPAAHETAHQWFYGLVGNDQASRAVRRRGGRRLRGALRPGPAARQPVRDGHASTSTIYALLRRVLLRAIYIQGGNLLDDPRRQMGSTAFWARPARVPGGQRRSELGSTRTLLDALDAATPIDLGRAEPCFPASTDGAPSAPCGRPAGGGQPAVRSARVAGRHSACRGRLAAGGSGHVAHFQPGMPTRA